MKITKKEIINDVAEKTGYSKSEIKEIFDEVLVSIVENLKDYEEIKLSPLGKFVLRQTKDRIGINPNTKEKVMVRGRTVVKFKPSTTFKNKVNE